MQGDNPIVVISGVRTQIYKDANQTPAGEGLVVHVPPANKWGKNFSSIPFQNTTFCCLCRVYTINISTTLNMSDGKIIEIGPGSFYEADITENKGISFTSNQPVMLAQYVKSGSHSPPRGDPAMLIVPPIAHFGHNVTFPVFRFPDARRYKHTHFCYSRLYSI